MRALLFTKEDPSQQLYIYIERESAGTTGKLTPADPLIKILEDNSCAMHFIRLLNPEQV